MVELTRNAVDIMLVARAGFASVMLYGNYRGLGVEPIASLLNLRR